MTTSIIALLYLADVAQSISVFCTILLAGCAISAGLVGIITHIEDGHFPKWFNKLFMVAGVAAVVGTVIPSKTTIYASAAVYMAGEFKATEEFDLVRKLVTQELRKAVDRQEKK